MQKKSTEEKRVLKLEKLGLIFASISDYLGIGSDELISSCYQPKIFKGKSLKVQLNDSFSNN